MLKLLIFIATAPWKSMDGAGCRALPTATIPAQPSRSPEQGRASSAPHTQPRPGRAPSPSRLTGEGFPRSRRGPGAAGVVAVPLPPPWWPEGQGPWEPWGPWGATSREAAPPPTPPMVRPGTRGPGRPGGRYHCRAGGASASARPAVRALRSASRACASPLPALQASSPALSSEDAALTSLAPRAADEKARLLSAAAYKALGRTTPSGGGLCHCSTGGGRRGSHFLPCGPWGRGAGGAAGIVQTQAQNPKKPPKPGLGTSSGHGQVTASDRDPRVAAHSPREHRPALGSAFSRNAGEVGAISGQFYLEHNSWF